MPQNFDFQRNHNGKLISLFKLANPNGLEVYITNLGAILVSIIMPDSKGQKADIILGFDNADQYLQPHPYFGAIVGRYANRIASGQFMLNNISYQLSQNDGLNHLHGGFSGLSHKIWDVVMYQPEKNLLVLSYLSRDGEEGFPGNLLVRVEYSLNQFNELKIDYHAVSDADTIINLTSHPYFNLGGVNQKMDTTDHSLVIFADFYNPVNEMLIPTGEIKSVEKTALDFRQERNIGKAIDENYLQTKQNYFDHNFVLRKNFSDELSFAARLTDEKSGRCMELYTTEPGLQFCTGYFLTQNITGKYKKKYSPSYGLCLEAQHFPATPNFAHFPKVILRKNDTYQQTTIHKFTNI